MTSHRQASSAPATAAIDGLGKVSADQLRLAVRALTEGVSLWDHDDRLVAFNDQLRDYFFPGRPDLPALGIGFEEFQWLVEREGNRIRSDDGLAARLAQVRDMHRRGIGRQDVELADGRWLDIVERRTPEGMIVSVYIDVTERRARERALALAKHEAEVANRAKSDFLTMMSHELRTPLNAVIGFAELISLEIQGPVGGPYKEYARDILASGRNLLEIVNDVLDLAKIEAGRRELREDTVDLGDIAERAARFVRMQATKSEIEVDLALPPGALLLRGDEQALLRVVTNLLSNAVKFGRRRGWVRVEGVRAPDGSIQLSVTDNGIGMEPADVPKALEPFGQIDNPWTRKSVGTGLGLPIVKSLVELHQGTLANESEVGVGTKVTLRFPAQRAAAGG
ncbi:MAG: PAS-domain containing protein [Alphaproteobacteria bacterium]|nr:PAS-domain containing protein [Alphaproteobacteria bacterium]